MLATPLPPKKLFMLPSRYMLSNTGELHLSLTEPLDIVVDYVGHVDLVTAGDLFVVETPDAEPSTRVRIDLGLLPGTPITLVGTEGTLTMVEAPSE
jgi:hypothetical protein